MTPLTSGFCRHSLDDHFPVAELFLAEQAHAGVPGTVFPAELLAPVRDG